MIGRQLERPAVGFQGFFAPPGKPQRIGVIGVKVGRFRLEGQQPLRRAHAGFEITRPVGKAIAEREERAVVGCRGEQEIKLLARVHQLVGQHQGVDQKNAGMAETGRTFKDRTQERDRLVGQADPERAFGR